MLLKKKLLILLILIFPSGISLCQNSGLKTVDINALVSLMDGSFSNEEQSEKDQGYDNITLHMKRMWTDRSDGKWLYVEQAYSQSPEKPYKQRVYRITRNDDGSLQNDVYSLKSPLRFAGEWQNETPLTSLSPDSLIKQNGCTVYFKLINDTTFMGKTKGKKCSGNLNGAKYSTSEVIITNNSTTIWDRGFNKHGTQVWGAVKGGYIFKRVK